MIMFENLQVDALPSKPCRRNSLEEMPRDGLLSVEKSPTKLTPHMRSEVLTYLEMSVSTPLVHDTFKPLPPAPKDERSPSGSPSLRKRSKKHNSLNLDDDIALQSNTQKSLSRRDKQRDRLSLSDHSPRTRNDTAPEKPRDRRAMLMKAQSCPKLTTCAQRRRSGKMESRLSLAPSLETIDESQTSFVQEDRRTRYRRTRSQSSIYVPSDKPRKQGLSRHRSSRELRSTPRDRSPKKHAEKEDDKLKMTVEDALTLIEAFHDRRKQPHNKKVAAIGA
eukprot:Nitzschia sp. Nitz4//scaffold87_size112219//56891//57721//NITZ4_004076-RA/size112219-processed-gene-0.133-mRNA-1//-1//CDS//3329559375//3934//frame0